MKVRFDEFNTVALGLSVDSVPSKKAWAEEETKHQRILEDQFYHMSNKGTIVRGE